MIDERTIIIRWPDSSLCANKRLRVRSVGALAAMNRLKRSYKEVAMALWILAGVPATPMERFVLTVQYFPPDARGRDRDNLGTALKPVLDAATEVGIIAGDSMANIIAEHHYPMPPDKQRPRIMLTLQEEIQLQRTAP